jgi:hypothetical protein
MNKNQQAQISKCFEKISAPLPINVVNSWSIENINLSNCLIDPKEKKYLSKIIGSKYFKTYLRFRGSRDGWKASYWLPFKMWWYRSYTVPI